jgi:signal transduction histidine kinase
MISMGERARMLGGKLSVESSPGRGARIGVQVPLQQAGT